MLNRGLISHILIHRNLSVSHPFFSILLSLLSPIICLINISHIFLPTLAPAPALSRLLCLSLSQHSSETKLWIDGDMTVKSVVRCQAATPAAFGSPDTVVMDE